MAPEGIGPEDLRMVLGPEVIPALTKAVHGLRPPTRPGALVVGLENAGEARAYPLNILAFHQAVNDSLSGIPIAITFCPLCNAAVVFERSVAGRTLTLSASGRLLGNNLVLRDEETGTLWSQLLNKAIQGSLEGTELKTLVSEVTPWEAWKAAHPGTFFLQPPNPQVDYGADHHPPYATSSTTLFPRRVMDERLHPKEVVAGLSLGGENRAYPLALLAEEPFVRDRLGGRDLILNYDQGAVRVFDLTGERSDGTQWGNLRGAAGDSWGSAPGSGSSAPRLPVLTTLWFCWVDFHPSTSIWEPGDQRTRKKW